jgi:hypothetical protein
LALDFFANPAILEKKKKSIADFLKLLDSKITKLTKTQQRLFTEVKSMYK